MAYVDVFITAVGAIACFGIPARGMFEEQTASAGVAGGADTWSSSATFFDYDRDGDLDLFVANYVKWSREIDLEVDYQTDRCWPRLWPAGQLRGNP